MNNIKGIRVLENANLKKLNTYKIDAKAKYLINVDTKEGLIDVLKFLLDNKIDYYILGAGSNVILGEYFEGAIIKLTGLDYLKVSEEEVRVGAGVMMPKLAKKSVDNNLTGLEWAINIPGTVGGSINGNAGAYNSEIFDTLVSIQALTKDLEIKEYQKEDIRHQYRQTNIQELGLIVLEATFKLEKGDKSLSEEIIEKRCKKRMETQPLEYPSAGSVFRNPEGDYAGRLIEEVGLKGKRIGDALVSDKHANFIVNVGNATSNDIKSLIKLVKEEVKEKFNIELIVEQEIVDWDET